MTLTEINKISIIFFLSGLNLEPAKNDDIKAFFFSPLHQENTPSFKVDIQKNLWYDFGLGEGGTLVDLIMKMDGCSPKDVLKKFNSSNSNFDLNFIRNSVASKKKSENSKQDDSFELLSVKNLNNSILLDYIVGKRGIDINIAKKFTKEIYFKKSNRRLFSIGFQNDIGGFELRNALYKGNLGGKAITTIAGSQNNGNLTIFEGFMDFLSALTFYGVKDTRDDVIILNSLSLLENSFDSFRKYKKIKLFLDNDDAGNRAKIKILQNGFNFEDYSFLYKNYKDFNDFLLTK